MRMSSSSSIVLLAALAVALSLCTLYASAQTNLLPFTSGTMTGMLPRTKNGIMYHLTLQKYVMWGGLSGPFNNTRAAIDERLNNNDVWHSTDGFSWDCVSGRWRASTTSDWTVCGGRADNGLFLTIGSTTCSDASGGLYVVGGEYMLPGNPRPQTHKNVFYSTDAGLTWNNYPNTGLTARSYANCVTTSDSVLVLNGILDYNDQQGDWRNPGNDVWTSTLGARQFTFVGNASYPARGAAMSISVVDASEKHYDRIIYVIGGWSDFTNRTLNNDIHYSVDAGLTWTNIRSVSRFSERADSELFSTPRGFLALVGGRTFDNNGGEWNRVNDIYLSADGGVSWYLRNGNFSSRIFPAVIAAGAKAQMLLAAGDTGNWQNDVRLSTLGFDNEPAITMQQFNMKPNRVTSSCFGLFACSNELKFNERNPNTTWSARSRHSAFLDSSNRIVVFGGMPTVASANVWKSADNGATWTQTRSTDMPARSGACFHADADGNMYVTGGWAEGDAQQLSNVSYVSTNGGSSWTQKARISSPTQSYAARSWHNCLSDRNGNVFILNGYGATGPLNDVYMSADQGATWKLVSSKSYKPRAGASTAIWRRNSFDLVYVLGGTTGYWDLPHDDVFVSIDGLQTFTLMSSDAPWAARQDGTLAVTSNGMLVLTGGLQTLSGTRYYFNDVWLSFDGGATWAIVEDAPYETRAFGVALPLRDESLAMIGGYGTIYDSNDRISWVDYNDFWVSGVKMNDVDNLKKMAEWTEPVSCIGPQVHCATINADSASSSSVSAGTVIGVLIAIPCGLFLIWALYSLRVHGEVRIPFTERSCNCCNSALRRDTLFDDEYSLHKGTGKYKMSMNTTASHRLMDD